MNKGLRILMLEDSPTDHELIKHELDKAGIAFSPKRVETREAFIRELEDFTPDLVLAGYSLSMFDGLSALTILREKDLYLPFIFVTGSMGEELAVEMLKKGATDYVLKDRLSKLVPAVQRALKEYEEKNKREYAEKVLRESEEKFRSLAEQSPNMIFINKKGRIVYANETCEEIMGYKREEFYSPDFDFLCTISPESIDLVKESLKRHMKGENLGPYECILITKEGKKLEVINSTRLMEYEGESAILGIITDITEHKRILEGLSKSKAEFEIMFNAIPDAVIFADTNRCIIKNNPAVHRMFGYTDDELIGNTTEMLYANPEEFKKQSRHRYHLGATEQDLYEVRYKRKDGTMFYSETLGTQVKNSKGNTIGFIALFRDISERKQVEARIRKSEQKLSLHVQQTPLAVIEWNLNWEVVEWNPAAEKIFGYTAKEIVGKHSSILLVQANGITVEAVNEVWDSLITQKGGTRSTNENLTKDGQVIFCEWYNTPLVDNDGTVIGVASLVQDITQTKLTEEKLNYLAYHDSLTDLPNRLLFKDRLKQTISLAKRRKEHLFALLFFDLDRFKVINDTLGHSMGDLLLQAVGERLNKNLREGDTISRLGGDEFTVVLSDVEQINEIVKVAQKILRDLSKAFTIKGQELFLSGSIGIACYPDDGKDLETLLKHADIAMYQAKAQGGNNFQFFSKSMGNISLIQMKLETRFRQAMKKDEFILLYQPQIDIKTRQVAGMEVLSYWEHADGLISPGEFIPMAEETGLIIPFGEWVLRQACIQNKIWQDNGYTPVPVAVNLSARQFQQSNLLGLIDHTLDETGLDPNYLELELTESMLMDVDKTTFLLKKLKDRGIRISIDDFGTGYSSLNYLKRFPIDTLKIDQSFVQDIVVDQDDAAITEAIIAMGHGLRLEVVAEGVETKEQLSILQEHQCDKVQGYYFSRPVTAEVFTDFLKGNGPFKVL